MSRRGYPRDMRVRAQELRQQGRSRAAIARDLGVSPSAIGRWFREDEACAPPGTPRMEARRLANARAIVERRLRQQDEQDSHRDTVGNVGNRELFLLGVALYWAEGAKSKPWRREHRVIFTNSDTTMIRLFTAWLDSLAVPRSTWTCRLSIHESADVAAAELAWRQVVGEGARWAKPTLKRHRPATSRLNVGPEYIGCLVVSVARSGPLYRLIAGTWEGIAQAAAASGEPVRSPVV